MKEDKIITILISVAGGILAGVGLYAGYLAIDWSKIFTAF